MAEWSTEWLGIKRAFCKPTTMCQYTWRVRRLIVPKLGGVELEDVTSANFRELGVWLAGREYGSRTISGALATFKGMMRGAAMEGLVEPRDWVYELPRAIDANEDKRVDSLSRYESRVAMDGLLETVENPSCGPMAKARKRKSATHELEHDRRNAMGCAIALGCGLRIGEVCALECSDFDTISMVVHVRGTAWEWVEDGSVKKEVGSPKTASSLGDVPLSARLADALEPQLKGRYLGSGRNSPPDRRALRAWWARFCIAAGIRQVRFHALRHTLGTLLIEDGVDPKTVSQILRHADVTTTLKYYVHPDVESMRKPVDGLWGRREERR